MWIEGVFYLKQMEGSMQRIRWERGDWLIDDITTV